MALANRSWSLRARVLQQQRVGASVSACYSSHLADQGQPRRSQLKDRLDSGPDLGK